MGLSRALLQGLVKSVFGQLGDVPQEIIYHSVAANTTADYDPATGNVDNLGTDYTIKQAVFVKFKIEETDKDVVALTDQKCLFPLADLPVSPCGGDSIIDEDGRVWEVVKVFGEPSKSLGSLQVRSTQ